MNLNSNQTCLILLAQQKGLISQFSPTSIKHVIDLYKPLTHFYRNHKIESYRPRFLITACDLLTIKKKKRERERRKKKIHGKENGNWTNNKILSVSPQGVKVSQLSTPQEAIQFQQVNKSTGHLSGRLLKFLKNIFQKNK